MQMQSFGFETMGLETYPLQTYEQPTKETENLMFTTAAESYNARPPALIARTQKFYNITAQPPKPEIDIEQVLATFDELWQNGDFDDTLTEQEYLSLRQAMQNPPTQP